MYDMVFLFLWLVIFFVLLPLGIILLGLFFWLSRKKQQKEVIDSPNQPLFFQAKWYISLGSLMLTFLFFGASGFIPDALASFLEGICLLSISIGVYYIFLLAHKNTTPPTMLTLRFLGIILLANSIIGFIATLLSLLYYCPLHPAACG